MANSNDKLELRSAQEKSESISKTDVLSKTDANRASGSSAKTFSYSRAFHAPPYNDLPFLHFPEDYETHATRYWHVPHTDDYFDACCRGYEYAFMFIKFLRDYSNDTVETNLLSSIAAHIDFTENSDRKGYWIGFFAYLERVLYERAKVMNFEQEWDRLQSQFEALSDT